MVDNQVDISSYIPAANGLSEEISRVIKAQTGKDPGDLALEQLEAIWVILLTLSDTPEFSSVLASIKSQLEELAEGGVTEDNLLSIVQSAKKAKQVKKITEQEQEQTYGV